MEQSHEETIESYDAECYLDFDTNLLYRDEQYTKLLENYVKNQKALSKAQLWYKGIFFIMVCVIFIIVVTFGILGIWYISKKDQITWQDIGAALAGLGSILSVIIILPSKIAEHLFPSASDKEGLEFVKSMQSYDMGKADGETILKFGDATPKSLSKQQQHDSNTDVST